MLKAKIQFVAPFTNQPRLVANESAQGDRTCRSAQGNIPTCSDHNAGSSKSVTGHGTEKIPFPSAVPEIVLAGKDKETADAAQLLTTDHPAHRLEEMFHLADIFAAIFEQCQNRIQTAHCHQRRRRPTITK